MMEEQILGIGQILWDLTVSIDYSLIKKLNMEVGGHKPVTLEEIQSIEQIITKELENENTILKNPGGSAANVMSNMAKLGAKTSFYGKHGKDDDGYQYMAILEEEGVTPISILDPEKGTGQLFSLITPDKDRTFIVYWGASESLPAENVDANLLRQFDLIHMEGYLIVNAKEALWKIFENAKNATFDLASFSIINNNRSQLQKMMKKFSPHILFANLPEGKAFTQKENQEDILDTMIDYSDIAVLTLGESGVKVKTEEGLECYQKAIETKPEDTTGAGDAFCAGFIYEYLRTKNIEKASKLGVSTASVTIQKIGARSFQKDLL